MGGQSIMEFLIKSIIGKPSTANRERDSRSEKAWNSKIRRERKKAELCVVDFDHSKEMKPHNFISKYIILFETLYLDLFDKKATSAPSVQSASHCWL